MEAGDRLAAGGGPVGGRCSQQEITAREQKVTTMEQDLEAAHSHTTERKQVPAGTCARVTVRSRSLHVNRAIKLTYMQSHTLYSLCFLTQQGRKVMDCCSGQ